MTGGWTPDLRSLGRGAAKDVQEVLAFAQRSGGWTGKRGGRGHIMLRHESGASATVSSTPSDHRSVRNVIAQIRRGGSS